MSITLTTVSSGYNLSAINDNFQELQDYINNNVLIRGNTGVAGEAKMNRDLDMNGFSILNADISTSSLTNDRALRVPTSESSIPPLPNAEDRKGKLLSFNIATGLPEVVVPESGSAADVLNQLAGAASNQGASLVNAKQQITGAVSRTLRNKLSSFIDVKDFGAVGDGVTDDSAAFQAALNYGMAQSFGSTVYFPEGKYYIATAGVLDRSADPTKARVSIKGAAHHSTLITAPNGFVSLAGSYLNTAPEPNASYQTISDLSIYGDGSNTSSVGISLNLCSFLCLSNLSIEGYGWGIYALDCDQSNFINLRIRWNYNAFLFNKNVSNINVASTQPNNMNWYGCTISNNSLAGGYVEGGSAWNFWGGDFENNGLSATAPDGWGFKMVSPGYEGGTGANFWGVYFESNAWGADVIFQNTSASINNAVTHSFNGCTFARATSSHYPQYNIWMSTGVRNTVGLMKLNVRGCTFKSAGSYVTSASRPYINWTGADVADSITFSQSGNIFEDAIETPSFCLYSNMFCTASRATNFPIATGTEVQWPLDTISASFGISPISNGFTIPVTGLYQVSFDALFDTPGGTDATGQKVANIKRNGLLCASGTSIGTGAVSVSSALFLNAGDVITFWAAHRYGATINLVGSSLANSNVHICRIS